MLPLNFFCAHYFEAKMGRVCLLKYSFKHMSMLLTRSKIATITTAFVKTAALLNMYYRKSATPVVTLSCQWCQGKTPCKLI